MASLIFALTTYDYRSLLAQSKIYDSIIKEIIRVWCVGSDTCKAVK